MYLSLKAMGKYSRTSVARTLMDRFIMAVSNSFLNLLEKHLAADLE